MFKKNSPELKILAVSIIIVFVTTVIAAIGYSSYKDMPIIFGIVALVIAILELFIGFILLVAGSKEPGKGFLVTAGILLLVSGASCGGYALMS
jgi:hypothetical protein